MVVPTYLGAMQLGGMLGYSPLLMSNMGQALTINGLTDHSRYVFRPSHLRQGSCIASQLRQGRVASVSYARFVFRQSVTPGSCFDRQLCQSCFAGSVTPGSCLACQLRQALVSPVSYARLVFRRTILVSTCFTGQSSSYLTCFVHRCTAQSVFCIRVTFIVCYRVAQRKVGRLKAS